MNNFLLFPAGAFHRKIFKKIFKNLIYQKLRKSLDIRYQMGQTTQKEQKQNSRTAVALIRVATKG
jgi:hypothetical protein